MTEPFLPFSRPSISQRDIGAVTEVLESGWITTGAKNALFEQAVIDKVGCQHAVALSSATAAMHLVLHAMKLQAGDEVITPSMTWVSTPNMIELTGAKPVFVDVDKNNLMTNADFIKPYITAKTRLIIPVHFAGAAAHMDEMRQLSKDTGIPLLEDAAHAIGTRYQSEWVGEKGDCIFSFHPIKNITTGEGGMFCTNDAALAAQVRQLKFHGIGVDAFDREVQGRSPQAEAIQPGYKYNLPDMNAALGISQLQRLEQFILKRTYLANLYAEQFANIDEILPLTTPETTSQHAWHLFIVRLDQDKAGINRDEFMSALKLKGIGTGLHFRAVHTQKYYRDKYPEVSLPNTEWNSSRMCSLPLFPDMTEQDVERVVGAIKSVLQRS